MNNESIELAVYVNNEKISNIPLKEDGYIFDKQNSSCTNNAVISWDNDTWSPVIFNINNYPTRCNSVSYTHLIYGYVFLYNKTGGYVFTQIITLVEPFPFVLIVSLFLLIVGSLVGMLGSWRAVKKYLKI